MNRNPNVILFRRQTMKLSTSTNLMDKVGDSFGVIPVRESVTRCKALGFDTFDFNFCDQGRPGHPVALADWETFLKEFMEFCGENDIVFTQTHLHMYDPADPRIEDHGWEREMLRRTVEGSGILKPEWAVAHPLHQRRPGFTREDYLQLNLEYYRPIVERAAELGYGISFENMVQFPGTEYEFACNADDLIELVDGFHMSNVGINWDFGHANISVADQAAELKKIGSRLKSTHIADNHGLKDEHLAPFYGNVDWFKMMKTLREIDYKGNFTYEVQAFSNPLPAELRDTQTRHLVDIGRFLIGKFEEG